MPRKRKRSKTPSNYEALLEEEKDLLNQLGLPKQFGGYLPNEQELSRPEKKQKTNSPTNYHSIGEHSVFTDNFTMKEILAFYPRGLNYDKEPSSDGGNEPVRIKFDDEGEPIIPSNFDSLPHSNHDKNSNQILETESLNEPISLHKYYKQRYNLFHRFDDGIEIDDEGWYSVTPEMIAKHISDNTVRSFNCCLIWDSFGGVGGNAIQFALSGAHAIVTEIDSTRLQMAKSNAKVYNVDQYIDFILADAFRVEGWWRNPQEAFDVTFSSPPWGGPSYSEVQDFDPLTMLPINFQELVKVSDFVSKYQIIYYMPKNTDMAKFTESLFRLDSSSDTILTIERHFLAGKFKILNIRCTKKLGQESSEPDNYINYK